jgi:hypothetical protein
MPAPTPDTKALLAWKASVTNMPYGPLMGWTGSNACTWGWPGVECDATGRVVGLRLKGMQLTAHGAVDWQALANLTALRTLELPVGCGCACVSDVGVLGCCWLGSTQQCLHVPACSNADAQEINAGSLHQPM